MALFVLVAMAQMQRAEAADLAPTSPHAGGYPRRGGYGELWAARDIVAGPLRPTRRVMGGPDYVGDQYGLGKPPVSGIGPRPDWGRSSYD